MVKFENKRILLKLSGESLMGSENYGIELKVIDKIAHDIKSLKESDVQICIVIGGGNIFRGLAASAKGMEMPAFIKEMEAIVYSGTKLNIDYWIDEILDEDQQEELHDYFMETETDKIDVALDEFDGDYDDEELRLYRIKFISEVAN